MDKNKPIKILAVQGVLSVLISTTVALFIGIKALDAEIKGAEKGTAASVMGSFALVASLVVLFTGLFSFLIIRQQAANSSKTDTPETSGK